jgi:ABC-type sulfate/molybdate transport systems ATPase subunit
LARRGPVIAALDVLHVSAFAGRRTVLRDVSLRVGDGALCAVIGPSGAGKTTMLRVAAGLADHEGAVLLDGVDVTHVPTHRRAVAMLFQEPRLFESMSAIDNVAYADRMRGVARRVRRTRAADLLDEVGLADRAEAKPAALSGGERQRVALARALSAAPSVLLLDEPLTALDAPRRAGLRSLIDRIRRTRNMTTLLVSHDVADAVALADRLAVMVDGALVQHDESQIVVDRPVSPTVARLTGNPNVLTDGPRCFTVRPERVVLGATGQLMPVTGVEPRLSHDLVAITSPWGPLWALVAPGSAPRPGDTVCVDVPDRACWTFPTVGPGPRIGGPS